MTASEKIEKWRIGAIYKLGAELGIVDRGSSDDNLHALVAAITGKAHISELTGAEGKAVHRELTERLRVSQLPEPPPSPRRAAKAAKAPPAPGMMTAEQQSKAWWLVYQLIDLDSAPDRSQAGARMCGTVKKAVGVEARPEAPFAWVTAAQGHKLIESLKRYLATARARKARQAGAG